MPHALSANTGPVETAAEELARKQSEAYFYAVESQLKQHGLDWSYQDYLSNEGWNLFDDSGVFIEGAQEQGKADGQAAAGAYQEGFQEGMREQFDTEEEYIAAMTAMGITDFPPFDEAQRQTVQEEGEKRGNEIGTAYLEGVDLGVKGAMLARQIALGDELDFTAAFEESNTPSGEQTNAKEVSQQLVEDIQSELESALAQLKETGGLTNVGSMMLEVARPLGY